MSESTTSLPVAVVEHRIPGRIRLRVRMMRGDVRYFEQIAVELSRCEGVRRVDVNPGTASILVLHDGDQAAVLTCAKEHGLFDVSSSPSNQHSPTSSALAQANRPLPALDLAAIGLAGAGVLQLARGRILGSASENLWNAYGLYAATRQTRVSALLVGFGLLQIMRGEVLGSAVSLFLYAWSARRLAQGRAAEDTI